MASVHLDGVFSELVPTRHMTSSAPTLAGLFEDLEARYPKLRFRIRDETGEVRRFIRVFVNGEEVRGPEGLGRRLGSKDEVDVLHSVQGG